ncbi:MAG TPA: hypothetical protein VGL46_17695 [Pseudonocardiaceae bacterium]|jgi:hypothetical protein
MTRCDFTDPTRPSTTGKPRTVIIHRIDGGTVSVCVHLYGFKPGQEKHLEWLVSQLCDAAEKGNATQRNSILNRLAEAGLPDNEVIRARHVCAAADRMMRTR